MAIKGSKQSNEGALSAELFIDRLSQISGISSKKMFGGYGVFHDGKMFALVNSEGNIYLKADDTIKAKFEDAGSSQHGKMPYFSLPKNVFNNVETLKVWVEESIDI